MLKAAGKHCSCNLTVWKSCIYKEPLHIEHIFKKPALYLALYEENGKKYCVANDAIMLLKAAGRCRSCNNKVYNSCI